MLFGAYVTSTYGKRRTDAAQGIATALYTAPYLDALVAPEFTNIDRTTTEQLSALSPGTLLFSGSTVIRSGDKIANRAYIARDGKLMHIYDKKTFCGRQGYSEGDHSIGGPQQGTAPHRGTRDGVFVTDMPTGKTLFGVEICNDHSRGYLNRGGIEHPVLVHERTQGLDYQIVIACGARFINNNAVVTKKDGVCLLVDGDKTPFSMAQRDGIFISPKAKITIPMADRDDLLEIYDF